MVAAVELDDDLASREAAGQAQGAHGGLGAGVEQPDHLHRRDQIDDPVGQLHLPGGGGAEGGTVGQRPGHGVPDVLELRCPALDALAHETRLRVFRLLVKAGPTGLTAGAIADELGALPNTMSSHLAKWHRAGIVTSERDGRHVIYRADFDAIGQLIVYLMEDCCNGNVEVCTPVAASIGCWQ